MMLDYLGENIKADMLEAFVAETIVEGKFRTYDMGGKNTTFEVAEEIARKLDKFLVTA
jgi:isocitrate/isopropylmalate dehydrogenase